MAAAGGRPRPTGSWCLRWLCLVALLPGAAAGPALTAAAAQRLAAMVDATAAMATSAEQLVATSRSLAEERPLAAGDQEGAPGAHPLAGPLERLAALNAELRALLARLRDELGLLFTSGNSAGLRAVLGELGGFGEARRAELEGATGAASAWVQGCPAPGAAARYGHFEALSHNV